MQQSALSAHRPLLFTSKADLHFFVHGNASQTSLNLPTYPAPYPARTAPAFHPTTSLFDRYFRTNLQLRDCDPRDVTTVLPNLVLHEQPLSSHLAEKIAHNTRNAEKRLLQTAEVGSAPAGQPLLKTGPLPASREYLQNEAMFNYKEVGEAKRKQKQAFLEEMERKIAEAEREARELEQLQEEERMEMDDLHRFQRTVAEDLTRNVEVGKLKQRAGYLEPYEQQERTQPMQIHQEMAPQQINEVLDEHFKLNEEVLEMAVVAGLKRGKSREKELSSTGFNHTMRHKPSDSKSLKSTMKNGLKPPPKSKK